MDDNGQWPIRGQKYKEWTKKNGNIRTKEPVCRLSAVSS